jgi:hypothetical protein
MPPCERVSSQRRQLPLRVLLGLDSQLDIRAVEAEHERIDATCKQPRGNIGARVASSAVAVTARWDVRKNPSKP